MSSEPRASRRRGVALVVRVPVLALTMLFALTTTLPSVTARAQDAETGEAEVADEPAAPAGSPDAGAAGATDAGAAGATDAGAAGATDDGAAQDRAAETVDAPRTAASEELTDDSFRPVGANLFPFYSREYRPSDETETLQLLGLYQRTRRPDGTGSVILLPFFFHKHETEPPDDRLYVFPLYYSRESDELSYRYVLPFYYDHENHAGSGFRLQALVPFWLGMSEEKGKLREDHVLFPLFRSKRDERVEDRPVRGVRLGLWKILELFERRTTPTTADTTLFNFLNWGDEAQSGLALFKSSWVTETWGTRGRTRLFPFYWHGRGAESSYRWLFPLFGYSGDQAQSDYTIIPLLSRFGSGPGEDRRLDLLFPLFHYARTSDSLSVASWPFFDWYRDEERQRLGILFWLYRHYVDEAEKSRTAMVLFPLSYFNSTNDGEKSLNWAGTYFDTWNTERRIRFMVPFFFKWQRLVGGRGDSYFTYGVPTYLSQGVPDDYWATGFPLYWAFHDNGKGSQIFFPFFWNFYSRISRDLHVVPLFSYRNYPHLKQFWFLGPLYVHERFYDLEERLSGTGHDVLWPILRASWRDDGYEYRFLPFFWVLRLGETRGNLITPFYFSQSGPEGSFRYLFPLYARFDSPRETREFAAAGAWTRHRVQREDGTLARETTNWLWWLATFDEHHAAATSHSRILPLLYWDTESPATSRTVAGPFWYSHRIADNDEVHDLSLVLGNLFFSKTVRGPERAQEATRFRPLVDGGRVDANDEGASTSDASTSDASDAESAATDGVAEGAGAAPDGGEGSDGPEGTRAVGSGRVEGLPGSRPRGDEDLVPYSTDRGILWPLTRWYEDDQGNSKTWALPVFAKVESPDSKALALFPFAYSQADEGAYSQNYFRYFFLFNRETWAGGSRTSVGQLLFDYRSEEQDASTRVRFLYPLFEIERSENSFRYQITPLLSGSHSLGGGERESRHQFFPLFWKGERERLDAEGNWIPESSHFYIFPLFGVERRETRVDYNVLYPFFHVKRTPESFNAEVWPFLFYRDNPALRAVRFWPLHAHEKGETAGDFWVTNWLFLSKYFAKENSWSYRLDPFLFRASRDEETRSFGALFEAFAWHRGPDELSFRAIPFAFGRATSESALSAFIPFHYRKDFGESPIELWDWPRFFFLTNSAKGAGGERHFTVLSKLFEYRWSEERPAYSQVRFLHRVVLHASSRTSKRVEYHPFFTYFRDDEEGRKSFSVLFSMYRQETLPSGQTKRVLFWFIPL